MSFQGKYVEEQFQFFFRQHWLRLLLSLARIGSVSIIILAVGAPLFFGPVIQEPMARHTVLSILALFFILSQFEFIERIYNYFLYVIIVSDRRIHRIKKTLFVTDDQQSIDLWVLQDINKSQHGPLQNILGFGTLILESQETTLKVHFVPRVSEKYERLVHLREQARKKWPLLGGPEE